jgi:hypothetical protein
MLAPRREYNEQHLQLGNEGCRVCTGACVTQIACSW